MEINLFFLFLPTAAGSLPVPFAEAPSPFSIGAVMPGTKLQEHAGNDKAWVWSTVDFAEEQQKVEMFAVRFGTVESKCCCVWLAKSS